MAAVVPYKKAGEESLSKAIEKWTGQPYEALRRNTIAEALESMLSPATLGARISRQAATKGIIRGFIREAGELLGRRESLRAARPHVGAVGRLPQEMLDLLEDIRVESLPLGTRAQYGEAVSTKAYKAAKAAGARMSEVPVARRRIYLDPLQAKPSSVYHEAGHLAQRTAEDPTLRRLLEPITEEFGQEASRTYKSLAERHARQIAAEALFEAGRRPGRRFTAKEFEEIVGRSLSRVIGE